MTSSVQRAPLPARFVLLLIFAVMAMAACLRSPIIAVGPLAGMIEADLHINSTLMGLIGAFPVLTFAVCSPFAAKLSERFGIEETIIGGLLAIAAGIALRTMGHSVGFMLVGTVLLSSGIAMGNVLLSAMIKRSVPHLVGRITSIYSATIGIMAGFSAAVALPIAHAHGWQVALNVWLLPVVVALVAWLALRYQYRAQGFVRSAGVLQMSVWHSRLAWMISLLMGLQSLFFYTVSAWLPMILLAKGVRALEAGMYVSVFQWVSLPTVFTVMALAVRVNQQRLTLIACLLSTLGVMALWLLPFGFLLWVMMMGVGASCTFTLCLLFFVARTDSAQEAAGLSGMAQTVGYCVAAIGPVGAGWLFDLTGSWQAPLAALTGLMMVKCVFGWLCARPITLQQYEQEQLKKKGLFHG